MFLVVILMIAGCRAQADRPAVPVVQLLDEFERAEKRPADGFVLGTHAAAGVVRPSLSAPVPSRVTWMLPMPRNGVLRAFVAVDGQAPASSVRFRIGVSDDRIYEGLSSNTVPAGERGWIGITTDLSAYAGFKWSLFYRPDRIVWHLVLAADAVNGGSGRAVWGAPEIVTDVESAREYVVRRHQLR